MPIASGTASLVNTAARVGQTIMDQIFAKRNIRLQQKANKELGAYNNQMNIENWKRENAYNSPKEQMKRYEVAGLNPNLIYGQGTSGNAGSLPNYQQPQTDVTRPLPQPLAMMGKTIGDYQDIELKRAQTDNVKTGTQLAVTKNAQDLLNLEFEKQFGWQRRMFENRNLGQKYDIGAQELEQQVMKTGQTKLLMPYQNAALQAEYQVKSRAMEQFNLDIALLNQKKEVNRAQIELMNSERDMKKLGLSGIQWENMLKGQEYNQKAKLFPSQLGTAEKNLKWLPWQNVSKIAAGAVGAGVGAYAGLKRGKTPVNTGTQVGGFTYYR